MIGDVKPHVIQILTVMRVSLHVMFAALLLFGIARYLIDRPASPNSWFYITLAIAVMN